MDILQVNNCHLLKKNIFPNLSECLTLHTKFYNSISINIDDYNQFQLHIDEKITGTILILGIKNDQINCAMIQSWLTGASANQSLRTKCLTQKAAAWSTKVHPTPDLQALYSNIQQLQTKQHLLPLYSGGADFSLVVIAKHYGPTAVCRNSSIVLGVRKPRDVLNYIERHAWVLCRH